MYSSNFMKTSIATALLLPILLPVGCATSGTPTEDPNVDQLGEFIYRYNGSGISAVVGYRFAVQSLGDEWLMLEFAASSPLGSRAKILREDVFVRTPNGTRLPMATQRDLSEAYGDLRAKLRRASIMRDPMNYFPGNRRPCRLGFFSEPGQAVTFDEVTLNDQRACTGRLFFMVPGGIQGGRWVLGIDLEEESVRIPFRL